MIGEISSVGIVLRLFIVGLELDPVELRRVATKIAALTLLEVGVAFVFGLVASYVLGLTLVMSIVLAMTAAISSTAIIGKIILERRMFQAEESKILVGLMIMEDIVAVGFLIFLPTIAQGGAVSAGEQIVRVVEVGLGGVSLLGLGYVVARFVAPYVIDYLSAYEIESDEILFLFALALGLLFGVLAAGLGYSPGIGAFVIGLSIRRKHSRFLFEKLATLKDLFLVLFFVSMGSLSARASAGARPAHSSSPGSYHNREVPERVCRRLRALPRTAWSPGLAVFVRLVRFWFFFRSVRFGSVFFVLFQRTFFTDRALRASNRNRGPIPAEIHGTEGGRCSPSDETARGSLSMQATLNWKPRAET